MRSTTVEDVLLHRHEPGCTHQAGRAGQRGGIPVGRVLGQALDGPAGLELVEAKTDGPTFGVHVVLDMAADDGQADRMDGQEVGAAVEELLVAGGEEGRHCRPIGVLQNMACSPAGLVEGAQPGWRARCAQQLVEAVGHGAQGHATREQQGQGPAGQVVVADARGGRRRYGHGRPNGRGWGRSRAQGAGDVVDGLPAGAEGLSHPGHRAVALGAWHGHHRRGEDGPTDSDRHVGHRRAQPRCGAATWYTVSIRAGQALGAAPAAVYTVIEGGLSWVGWPTPKRPPSPCTLSTSSYPAAEPCQEGRSGRRGDEDTGDGRQRQLAASTGR